MGKKRVDITGQRFGKLVARDEIDMSSGSMSWICDCDCGGQSRVTLSNLRSGTTRSCGCLHRRDLTGKRFGKLVAVESTGVLTSNGVLWVCKCDCGDSKEVPVGHLTRKDNVKSCGCSKRGINPDG